MSELPYPEAPIRHRIQYDPSPTLHTRQDIANTRARKNRISGADKERYDADAY